MWNVIKAVDVEQAAQMQEVTKHLNTYFLSLLKYFKAEFWRSIVSLFFLSALHSCSISHELSLFTEWLPASLFHWFWKNVLPDCLAAVPHYLNSLLMSSFRRCSSRPVQAGKPGWFVGVPVCASERLHTLFVPFLSLAAAKYESDLQSSRE